MKPSYYILCLLTIGTIACAPVKNTMPRVYQKKLAYHDAIHAPLTDIVHIEDMGNTAVISPLGIEVFDAEGKIVSRTNHKIGHRIDAIKIPSLGKNKVKKVIDLKAYEKVVIVPLPQQNAVLMFDFSPARVNSRIQNYALRSIDNLDNKLSDSNEQTLDRLKKDLVEELNPELISMIDLSTGKIKWVTNQVSWNFEKYSEIWKLLTNKLGSSIKNPKARAAFGEAAGEFFPKKYIQDIITFIPEKNAMIVSGLTHISLLDLESGALLWKFKRGFVSGISHVHYESESESIVLFGGNPLWFPSIEAAGIKLNDHVQINKDIIRLDYQTGNVIWQTKYSTPILARNEGNFTNSQFVRVFDTRVDEKRVFVNAQNIEVFDFEQGNKTFETETGRKFIFTGYNPPLLFAFPVEHNGFIYNTSIDKILAFGASVGNKPANNFNIVIEAYNTSDNSIAWTSDAYARQMVNNMSVWNNILLTGFNKSTGVIAFNVKDGSIAWEYPLGRGGVSTKWIILDGQLILAEKNVIHIINISNGEPVIKINADKHTGSIEKIYVHNNQLLVVGKKKGAAMYNVNDGALVNSVKTGFNADLYLLERNYVLASIFPENPILLLDQNNFKSVGSLSKSKHRTALAWSENSGIVFDVRKGRLNKYQIK
jgi:hypothetical protein